jgi:acyl-coenzyme A synthetase/AMP-(fatty) acid ligase
VLLPAYKPDELAQTVERERPSALWAGPAHLAACRNAGLFDKHDWSSLELAIDSGSIAQPALMREVAAKLPRCALTQL